MPYLTWQLTLKINHIIALFKITKLSKCLIDMSPDVPLTESCAPVEAAFLNTLEVIYYRN